MPPMPQAPDNFDGALDQFYNEHAKHVLIARKQIEIFHRTLMAHLEIDDPVYLIRKVKGLERGETIRTRQGHLVRATDNSPPWYIHHELFTSSFSDKRNFSAFMDSVPCHMFHINLPQSVNSKKWHVAHLFDVNNRDTDFQSWGKDELRRRMTRSIHPCNYFYIPKEQWRRYGGAKDVLSYFYKKYSELYHDVWEEFLAIAKAEPIPYTPDCVRFKYSIKGNEHNVRRNGEAREQPATRMTFKKAWLNQDVTVTFTYDGITYRYPHDELLSLIINQLGIVEGTVSWERDGNYNFRSLSKKQKVLLEPYIVG